MVLRSLLIVLTICCAVIAAKAPAWHELTEDYTFAKYCKDFNKVYNGQDNDVRRKIFEDKLRTVLAHNQNNDFSWKRGINHMSDWTNEELSSLKGYDKNLGFAQRAKRAISKPAGNFPEISLKDLSDLPDSVDWREKGVISPVKDQGRCGSCWTFGAAETLESWLALGTGRLVELSEQMILDCVPNPNDCGDSGGCQGGTVELAYNTLISKQMSGLASEWTYPYRSYFGANFNTCLYNASQTPALGGMKGFNVLPANQYVPVMNALATGGPLAINVDASAWHDYESGVFNGCNQANPDIDHVVQLVGYGSDPALGDFWTVRNSWTPNWGEKGYIRLLRSQKVVCGTDNNPQDGTGCKGSGPQTVCGTCGVLFDVSYPLLS